MVGDGFIVIVYFTSRIFFFRLDDERRFKAVSFLGVVLSKDEFIVTN